MILWRTNFELDNERLDDVIGRVNGNPNVTGKVGMYTTYYVSNIYSREEVVFAPQYKEILAEGLSALGVHHRCSYTFDHWMQVYAEGNVGHSSHDHYSYNTIVSWVHFVRPTTTKAFYFMDSSGNKNYPEQNEGDFIMFNPWALHGVDPSKELRTVIAGNVFMSELISPDTEESCKHHTFRGSNYNCVDIPKQEFLL